MRLRRSVFVLVAVALVASVLLVGSAAGTDESGTPPCDPDYVRIHDWPYKVTVLPTGVDDTKNLQCALDYGADRDWAKIMLVAGDYYTSFLEAEGFDGVFKGAGRGHTSLMTLPEGLDCATRDDEAGDVVLLAFAGGNVLVKGITFGIGGEAACAEPFESWTEPDGTEIINSSIIALMATTRVRKADTCLDENVDHRFRVFGIGVESEFPPFGEPVVEKTGFVVGVAVDRLFAEVATCPDDRLHGTVIVRNSHITGSEVAVGITSTDQSKAYIGGHKPWQGNTFENVGVGVFSAGHNDSRIMVKGNEMLDVHFWGALAVGDWLDGEPSRFVAKQNKVRGIDLADGLGVLDFGPDIDGVPRVMPMIGWNKIEMVDTEFNGIFVLGTDGRIIGNKITGTAVSGIMMDGIGYFDDDLSEFVTIYPSQGWEITRNWFPKFDFGLADIVLWDATEDNFVECAWWGHEVLDFGVDNEIVNCAVAPEPFAVQQTIDLAPARADKELPTRFGR